MQGISDTRACAANTNSANCDGQYPVTVLAKPGVGSGACIDSQTQRFPQVFQDEKNTPLAELDLYWSPTCQTYFAHALFFQGQTTITVKVVEHSGLGYTIDGTRFEYFNVEQSSGSVQGSDVWSPMKWSSSGSVSAEAKFSGPNGGTLLTTPRYIGGVPQ